MLLVRALPAGICAYTHQCRPRASLSVGRRETKSIINKMVGSVSLVAAHAAMLLCLHETDAFVEGEVNYLRRRE